MKKKLIITFVLFVLAGVIFAVQMPRKDNFACVTKLEAIKAQEVMEDMLAAVNRHDIKKFRDSWSADLSIEQINCYCKPFAAPVAKEFVIYQAVTFNNTPNTIVLFGSFDTNTHNHRVVLKKTDNNDYRIAEIKELL